MIRALRTHLAIGRQFVHIGLVRKSQFRVEFLNQVLMDVLFYGSQLAAFTVVFGLREGSTLAGWTLDQTLVLLGLVFVHDGFSMTWLGQGWHFGNDLKAGNLDPVRVRPGHPVVLYFFQRFSLPGLVNLAIAFGIFGWALARAGAMASPLALLTLPWAVLLAWWGQTCFTVLGSLAELYVLNSDLGRLVNLSVGTLSERPLDVYGKALRRVFVFALPAGAMSYIPACLVLGRISPLAGLAYTGFYLVMGLAIIGLWRWSFHRYESAMG